MANNVVTKKSLVDVVYNDVHDYTKVSKKTIAEIVNALFSEMKADLELGNHLRIADFGTFKVIDKPATTGVNPRTQEKIVIPARRAVKFVPAKSLKEELNEKQ